MRPVLILCFVALACLAFASPAVAGCGPNGCTLTLDVPAQYEIQAAKHSATGTAISTAGRSAACVGKVAAAVAVKPIRAVAIVHKKPLRHAVKAVASARPFGAVAVGGARLIWHRRDG